MSPSIAILKRNLLRLAPILPLALFLAGMPGCASFSVVAQNDPYKGVTDVTVDMWHTVVDSRIDNVRALYHKQISGDRVSDPTVTFVFVAAVDPYYYNYQGESLSREAYLMVDSERFPVTLVDSTNVPMKRNSAVYDYYFYGYSHFFYYPGVIIWKETNSRVLTAKIRLASEIRKALAGASSYTMRFYCGDMPITLEATQQQLDALKKFLAYEKQAGPPRKNQPAE
ncbi:MAG: hypothetical protein KA369_16695 [Spirochaetes bacterium]|nr:hypothetical protein [Spirochaetota bacterium]